MGWLAITNNNPGDLIKIEVPPSEKPTTILIRLTPRSQIATRVAINAPREVQINRIRDPK